MKGTKNLSKKSAIPASIPKENQSKNKKRTKVSTEIINKREFMYFIVLKVEFVLDSNSIKGRVGFVV